MTSQVEQAITWETRLWKVKTDYNAPTFGPPALPAAPVMVPLVLVFVGAGGAVVLVIELAPLWVSERNEADTAVE